MECLTVWIQIRADVLSGLSLRLQAVDKGSQQETRPGERVYSYNNYGRPSAVVLDRFHNLLVKSKLIMFSLKDLIMYTADQMKKC